MKLGMREPGEWLENQGSWIDYKLDLIMAEIKDCDRKKIMSDHCTCALFIRECLTRALRRGAAKGPQEGESFDTSFDACARCGERHQDLRFNPLTYPADEWTHWAPCPTNGEPIMLCILESNIAQREV